GTPGGLALAEKGDMVSIRYAAVRRPLEGDSRSQAEDQGVGNRPRRGCRRRQRSMSAGMENHLQIRLQSPPRRNAGLVGNFEHGLVIPYRAAGAREQDLIPVQTAGIPNPPKGCTN